MKITFKKASAMLMALCLMLTMLPMSTLAAEDEPALVDGYYEIYTADQLYWFAEQVNSGNNAINGKLMADIVVNENVLNEDGTLNGDGSNFRVWTPIGDGSYRAYDYAGIFDGNGKIVSGLYFSDIDARYIGLIGSAEKATIQNVGVVDSYFQGNDAIGGVVGDNYCSTVRNCFNAASVNGSESYSTAGGVIGSDYGGTIENCFNIGVVTGDGSTGNLGGVAGDIYSKLKNCYTQLGSAPNAGGGSIMSEEAFASGEVAYLLQGSSSEPIWGQKIGVDAIPQFGGEKVYCVCDGTRLNYTNDANAESTHVLEDGNCFVCGIYAPAELNGDVYELYNDDQLYWFAQQVNSGNNAINGKLMADIVVNENVLNEDGTLNGDGSNFRVWTPIGNSDNSYIGTFDGNGKTVSGLYFNDAADYVGLLGYVSDGCVKNAGVVDSYFQGYQYIGGVVGYNDYYSTVSDCYNTGTVSGSCDVGGVVGYNDYYGTVSDCYNTGTVSGQSFVGGVVGDNGESTIINCYNMGNISGNYYTGGVSGSNIGGTISGNNNSGNVNGKEEVGGIIGFTNGTIGTVKDNSNSGIVNGEKCVGGIAGNTYYSGILDCNNTGCISGDSEVGGITGCSNTASPINNCKNSGTINGNSYVGGVSGYCYWADINLSYNTGDVKGTADYVGGVVGRMNGASISDCYNIAKVVGGSGVGGIAGYVDELYFGETSDVNNCYNTGVITGLSNNIGAVVGCLGSNGLVTASYYLLGCAIDGNGVVQNGIGCETQGSSTEDVEGSTTAMTAEQFASGEVCWLLSGGPTSVIAKKNEDENPWGQKIGQEKFPVFSEDEVYCITDEQGNVLGYSNVEGQLPQLGVTLSGSMTSYLADGDVTVQLLRNGEIVDSLVVNGMVVDYAFEGVAPGDYTIRVMKENHVTRELPITIADEDATLDGEICPVGDVTGDGVVNVKDYQRLLRHVNKTSPLSGYELACGDVTNDGSCNVKDFQRLLRHVNKTNPLF